MKRRKTAQGGRCITRNGNTLLRRPGAQPVGVIDVGGAGQDGRHQYEDLAAGTSAADAVNQSHRIINEHFQTEPL